MTRNIKNTEFIKSTALALGFDFCGIAKAEFLKEEAPKLEEWLNKGMHGEMKYMENHFDKRLDPTKLVPGAKSVITLLNNYFPPRQITTKNNFKLSKYAYGEDYHFVIKRKLKEFMERITKEIGEIHGRVFVDSAPVLERVWAMRSGVGWIGKNSLLINKDKGSFFFIAELIIDLQLEYDQPIKDYCGTCTQCIDACPTNAIVEPYVVDGSKCISYFTIELKDKIPPEMQGKFNDWIFGCDICQDVCPWNRFSQPHNEPSLLPSKKVMKLEKKEWIEMTETIFTQLFEKSAIRRTAFSGMKRNITFVGNRTAP